MIRVTRPVLAMVALSLVLGACATAPPAPEVGAPASRPTLPVEVAPAPSPVELLAAAHRQKAEALEREGHVQRALDEWKIALTISPEDPAAREGRRRIEARIEREVSERIGQGREALARGAHVEARRHFLAALAMDPANRVAFEALRTEVKEVPFLSHTVGRGETLATIAERYYGDRSRLEVIWETNQLPPNPRLVVGTTLKIPEIPGVPFVHPKARQEPSRGAAREGSAPSAVPRGESPRDETPEVNPLLVEAREAFEKGQYVVALADVDKLLAGNPQSPEAVDLKKAALYGLGKSQLTQSKFEDSYRTLTQLARLAPNYQDSPSLLGQARTRLIQEHYNEGIRLFREEKLEGAIARWRTVLEYDPQHADAKKNIEQAQRLLRGLQQRQRR